MSAAQQALEDVAAPGDTEYVWNIQGYAALLDNVDALIDATHI